MFYFHFNLLEFNFFFWLPFTLILPLDVVVFLVFHTGRRPLVVFADNQTFLINITLKEFAKRQNLWCTRGFWSILSAHTVRSVFTYLSASYALCTLTSSKYEVCGTEVRNVERTKCLFFEVHIILTMLELAHLCDCVCTARRLPAPPHRVLPPGRCSRHRRVLSRRRPPPATHHLSGWSAALIPHQRLHSNGETQCVLPVKCWLNPEWPPPPFLPIIVEPVCFKWKTKCRKPSFGGAWSLTFPVKGGNLKANEASWTRTLSYFYNRLGSSSRLNSSHFIF